MTNREIYEYAKLSADEINIVESYFGCGIGRDDYSFYDTGAYTKLFEYFVFESGEMPYGIAKARTGDPDQWIIERLESGR